MSGLTTVFDEKIVGVTRDKDRGDPETTCSQDIAGPIADHPGSGEIDVQIVPGTLEQFHPGLPALANTLELRHFTRVPAFGMMRAGVNRIEIRVIPTEFPLQFVVN